MRKKTQLTLQFFVRQSSAQLRQDYSAVYTLKSIEWRIGWFILNGTKRDRPILTNRSYYLHSRLLFFPKACRKSQRSRQFCFLLPCLLMANCFFQFAGMVRIKGKLFQLKVEEFRSAPEFFEFEELECFLKIKFLRNQFHIFFRTTVSNCEWHF